MHRVSTRGRTAVLHICTGLMAVLAVSCFGPGAAYASTGEPGLIGKSIVIDAGHGGPDSGARGSDGTYEKNITLPVAMQLGALLQEAGATVHFTRATDDDLATDEDRALRRRQSTDLRNRVLVAKKYHADVFVSVHCNAVTTDKWNGAQTLYQHDNVDGKLLANTIQQQFRTYLLPTRRSADATSTLYLLKRIPNAAVIAEIGFLSNPAERNHLGSPRYQKTVAYSMYLGVQDYFSQVSPSSEPVGSPGGRMNESVSLSPPQ